MLLFYATAAFYAFYRWREERRDGWLLALGLVCGFAGGVKYTAVAVPVALGLSIIWESRRDGLIAAARRLGLVALPAGLLVTPWLIENWITTGNPVYPFFFNDALYWDEWRAWWYDRPGTGLWATAPWRLLTVPLEATIAGTEGSDFYEATIGPFILSVLFFLPLVWGRFRREQKALLAHMGLFFLINYLLWLNGVARTALLLRARFLFFVFGVTAVIGGAALDRLQTLTRPQLDVGWLVRTFVSITLAGLLFTQFTTFLAINPLPPALGLEAEADYVQRRLGAYQPAMARLNELPPASEVVFLWEARSYACREVLCHPDPILDRFLHLTHHEEYEAAEITAVWQERGFTHVLLYQGGLDFLLEQGFDPIYAEDLAILSDLQENYWRPVETWGDAYILYEIMP
jgi:4-amino-4-deoxy-L-arabinose transferase-like glycosyltransferase